MSSVFPFPSQWMYSFSRMVVLQDTIKYVPRTYKWLFIQVYWPKLRTCFSFLPPHHKTSPSHAPLFVYPKNVWRDVKFMRLFVTNFSQFPCCITLLVSNTVQLIILVFWDVTPCSLVRYQRASLNGSRHHSSIIVISYAQQSQVLMSMKHWTSLIKL